MRIHRTYSTALCLLIGLLLTVPLAAQQEPPSPEQMAITKALTPGSQHAFLATHEGTWKVTLSVWMDPAAPPIEGVGTAERKMILGGRVLHDVVKVEIMGTTFEAVGHTGYDNVIGKYWSTWFDNMSTGLSALEGTMDESTGQATLVGDTPEAVVGRKVPMRLEIYDEDGKQVADTYMPLGGREIFLAMRTVSERQ